MSTMGYVSTMEGAAASANLSLDFEKQSYRVLEGGKQVNKGFDELLTFSRATTGGRFNEKGLYETVPANQPRFDYDPITKVLKGLLVEEQRTNLVTMSEQLGSWQNYLVTSKRAEIASPSGTLNATKVIPTTDPSWHQLRGNVFAVTASNNYTTSVFAKKGENDIVRVTLENATLFPSNSAGVFNLSTGTVVSGAGAKIQDVGDGWYRCSVTSLCAVTGTTITALGVGSSTYVGDGVSGLYFWGAQVEMGIFATSYIPTEATFTSRASTATYFDKNGVLRTASVNVARTGAYLYDQSGVLQPVGLLSESAATNLFDNSEDFDLSSGGSTWGKNFVTVSPSDVVSPTGEGFYRNVVISYVAGTPALVSKPLTSIVPASIVTLSFYVKAGTASKCSLRFYDSIGEAGRATFDLVTGTVQATLGTVNLGGTITRMKDDAYRISLTCDYTTRDRAGVYAYLVPDFAAAVVGKSILVWGAQLETGRDVTSYIRSKGTFTGRVSTATYLDAQGLIRTVESGVARADTYRYDSSGRLRSTGLLLENNSTNRLKYSQDLTKPEWSKVAITAAVSSALSPDPSSTATKLVSGATIGVSRYAAQTVTFNGQAVFTLFAKKAEFNFVWIGYLGRNATAEESKTAVDLTTLQQANIGGSSPTPVIVTPAGNGWVKITLIRNAIAGSADVEVRIGMCDNLLGETLTGDGISGVYVWGAQLEAGAYPTSYIATTTAVATRASDSFTSASATRAADVTSSVATTRSFDKASLNNLSWYNNTESSFVTDFTSNGVGVGNAALAFRLRTAASANASAVSLYKALSSTFVGIVIDPAGAVTMQGNFTNAAPDGVRVKGSLGYKVNSGAVSVSGKPAFEDTSLVVPTPEVLHIGQNGSDSQSLNGYVHSIHYYPLRLSSPQLQIISE